MDERRPLGSPLKKFSSVSSTNDLVKAEAEQGAAEGLAVLADRQEKGRGRQGRTWLSPAGEGVYLSVLLRPGIPAGEANWLGVVGALAVASALERAGLQTITLKWPNDVLARGRKIAGILVEPRLHGPSVEFAVLGIGINVAQEASAWPGELSGTATSCRTEGVTISRDDLARIVLEQLDRLYSDFTDGRLESLLLEWTRRTGTSAMPVLE
ncbi:MAG: biotin--[acetyl-CoA-carboxylase] ligase [Verrucomicrobia bacterium]|nr:biotin--[acetyl-CoA-carboxylase] ligase [Verrucomicrobiota bacterium]